MRLIRNQIRISNGQYLLCNGIERSLFEHSIFWRNMNDNIISFIYDYDIL